MRTRLSAMVVGLGVLFTTVPMVAHHSFSAEYDSGQRLALRGVITEMEWINPHAWLHVDVKDANGQVVNWAIECGAPQALFRRGWTKKSLQPGLEVIVQGYRAKDASLKVNGETIRLPDGRSLFAGSPGTPGAPTDSGQNR